MELKTPASLDFDDQVLAFINFLKSKDEFKDYNFEGSNIREICRLLGYNSTMEAYKSNVVHNEIHLDTAQEYNNAASLCNILSYVPSSLKSSRFNVNIYVTANDVDPVEYLTLNKDTDVFQTNVDGTTYNFSPDKNYTAQLSDGQYTFENVCLLQGNWVKNTFEQNGSDSVEFVIPNDNIDISTLIVTVQESSSSSTQYTYKKFENGHDLGNTSKIYYLGRTYDGKYYIRFGDNNISKRLDNGNIVILDYIVTKGESGNNLSNIQLSSNIGDTTSKPVVVPIDDYSYGGSSRESLNSIKYLAPLSFPARGNCVTDGDYKIKTFELCNNFGITQQVNDVDSWSGINNNPPKQGYVFIAVKPFNGGTLSNKEKDDLVVALKKYNVGSITPIITDPSYLYLNLTCEVYFDQNKTSDNRSVLKNNIIESINSYSDFNLEKFKYPYYNQNLATYISSLNEAYINTNIYVKYEKQIEFSKVYQNTLTVFCIKQIKEKSLYMDNFSLFVDDASNLRYYMQDDGLGAIKVYREYVDSGVVEFVQDVGNVDYDNSIVNFVDFKPVFDGEFLSLYFETKEDDFDVFPETINVAAINKSIINFNQVDSPPIGYKE